MPSMKAHLSSKQGEKIQQATNARLQLILCFENERKQFFFFFTQTSPYKKLT